MDKLHAMHASLGATPVFIVLYFGKSQSLIFETGNILEIKSKCKIKERE